MLDVSLQTRVSQVTRWLMGISVGDEICDLWSVTGAPHVVSFGNLFPHTHMRAHAHARTRIHELIGAPLGSRWVQRVLVRACLRRNSHNTCLGLLGHLNLCHLEAERLQTVWVVCAWSAPTLPEPLGVVQAAVHLNPRERRA